MDSKVDNNWYAEKAGVKDKWREKRWITVNAPESFNSVPIAYVPITDDENAVGRVLEVTLFDILKGESITNINTRFIFKLTKLKMTKQLQFLKDFEYSKEFLRSLVRRGSSKINFIIDIKNKRWLYF